MPVASEGGMQAPLVFVMNAASGRASSDETGEAIASVLASSGRVHEVRRVHDPRRLAATAAAAAADARERGGILVGVGGDGTLGTVAGAALRAGCVFAAVPCGTFNYFGRANRIPTGTANAVRALLDGRIEPIQVGTVNDRVFLVNASLGLYPKLLQDREAFKEKLGRSRLVAIWAGLWTLLRHHGQLRLQLEHAEGIEVHRTPTLVVVNNQLQLAQMGLPEARDVQRGRLAAILLRPVSTGSMLGLLIRGAFGRLGDAENVISFDFAAMTVRPLLNPGRLPIRVATDGEIAWMRPPLTFRVAGEPLRVVMPAPGSGDGDDAGSGDGDAAS